MFLGIVRGPSGREQRLDAFLLIRQKSPLRSPGPSGSKMKLKVVDDRCSSDDQHRARAYLTHVD